MTTEDWWRFTRLAGIVTTRGLLAAGYSLYQIRAMTFRGELIRLASGVYARADFASSLELLPAGQVLLAAAAATSSLGLDAVASHHTAAQLHGLDLLNRAPEGIAVTRSPGSSRKSPPHGVLLHSAGLPAAHVGGRLVVPVTTVPRTVVDLARTLSFREGVVVADSALRQKLTSKKELREVLADCPRWKGVRQARAVVEFADGLAESVLESLARMVFADCGLPPPELQVVISHQDVRYRADFMWRQFGTIAEVDGQLKYDDRARFGYERRRDLWLRERGYEVIHFSWQEITQQPEYVNSVLRAAFRRGSLSRSAQGPAA